MIAFGPLSELCWIQAVCVKSNGKWVGCLNFPELRPDQKNWNYTLCPETHIVVHFPNEMSLILEKWGRGDSLDTRFTFSWILDTFVREMCSSDLLTFFTFIMIKDQCVSGSTWNQSTVQLPTTNLLFRQPQWHNFIIFGRTVHSSLIGLVLRLDCYHIHLLHRT